MKFKFFIAPLIFIFITYKNFFFAKKTLFLKQTSYIYIYIFHNFCDFFFSLILYFWKSNLYSGYLIFAFWFSSVQSLSSVRLFVTPWITARQASLSIVFGICYEFCTFKNPIFSTHFYLGARLLAWLLSPPLHSPFFSTRSPLSTSSPFSTQLCESPYVFQTVENT